MIYPQKSTAEESEGFLSKHFLEMEDVKKKFWISGAISTLSNVAMMRSKAEGMCVFDWYYKDIAAKNGLILAAMAKYPHVEPSAIVIALAEQGCGKFVARRD